MPSADPRVRPAAYCLGATTALGECLLQLPDLPGIASPQFAAALVALALSGCYPDVAEFVKTPPAL